MEVKAKIVFMSHLSDIMEEARMMGSIVDPSEVSGMRGQIQLRANFLKFLVLKLNGNLSQDIDVDQLWSQFMGQFVS